MSFAYIDLVDYVAIAAAVTGSDVDALVSVTKLDLADSALQAPAGGLGSAEALCRLEWLGVEPGARSR